MSRQFPQSVLLLNELTEKIFKYLGIERKFHLGLSIHIKILIQMAKSELSIQPNESNIQYYKKCCDKAWDIFLIDVETRGKNQVIELVKHYYNTKLATQRDLELLQTQPKN